MARSRLVVSPEILDEYEEAGKDLAVDFAGVDLQPLIAGGERKHHRGSSSPIGTVCDDPDDVLSPVLLHPAQRFIIQW
jgi:hypothetical protein